LEENISIDHKMKLKNIQLVALELKPIYCRKFWKCWLTYL